MLEELKPQIKKLEEKLLRIEKYLQLESKKDEIASLKKATENPSFWGNADRAKTVMQKLKSMEVETKEFDKVDADLEELSMLLDTALDEGDRSLEVDIRDGLLDLEKRAAILELTTLFSGKYDKDNAIISINAGAGGTDAQDWAQILFRMYFRFLESKSFAGELVDISYGEEAGIKSATLIISGPYAYGYLKGETGIHRLVRISPFDSNKRRHTSFASVEVIPEISADFDVTISEDDLKIETFRSSGPGGQNMQKTESAVRITHIPTGIVAQSQNDRSQYKNKEMALKIVKARLHERLLEEKKEKIEELRGIQKDIAWGNQIRSYVFQPYTLVKDHRTGTETGNVSNVLDGNIDLFIDAYLRHYIQKEAGK